MLSKNVFLIGCFLAVSAHATTIGEVDSCMKEKHDTCLDSCLLGLPEDKRPVIKKCVVNGYDLIHDAYERCMETDPNTPCWRKPSYIVDDQRLKHSKERESRPGENAMVIKLKNLGKCEKDCVKNARNSCVLQCDEATPLIMKKVRNCRKKINMKEIKNTMVQCIIDADLVRR